MLDVRWLFSEDFAQFQYDVEAAVNEFKTHRVDNILIDVTNNGGLYAYLIYCPKN